MLILSIHYGVTSILTSAGDGGLLNAPDRVKEINGFWRLSVNLISHQCQSTL